MRETCFPALFFLRSSVCTLDASLRLPSIRGVDFKLLGRVKKKPDLMPFLALPQTLQTGPGNHDRVSQTTETGKKTLNSSLAQRSLRGWLLRAAAAESRAILPNTKKSCPTAAAARRWHRSPGPVARSSAAGSRERVRRTAPAAYTHTAEGRQMRGQICAITPPRRSPPLPTPLRARNHHL